MEGFRRHDDSHLSQSEGKCAEHEVEKHKKEWTKENMEIETDCTRVLSAPLHLPNFRPKIKTAD